LIVVVTLAVLLAEFGSVVPLLITEATTVCFVVTIFGAFT